MTTSYKQDLLWRLVKGHKDAHLVARDHTRPAGWHTYCGHDIVVGQIAPASHLRCDLCEALQQKGLLIRLTTQKVEKVYSDTTQNLVWVGVGNGQRRHFGYKQSWDVHHRTVCGLFGAHSLDNPRKFRVCRTCTKLAPTETWPK
jgi:hypothetical protein